MASYRGPFAAEYSVDASAPLSEKVLKEKRKKLKETLERVLKLYVSHRYRRTLMFGFTLQLLQVDVWQLSVVFLA